MKQEDTGGPIQILLVEDNPGDARLTVEALKEGRVPTQLHVAADGDEAMAFLRKEGKFEGARRPDIILLDLNLPRRSGSEVLRDIKADASLRTIPVIVLSTSRAATDVEKSYDLQASCYITKPTDVWRFFEAMKSVEDFWLATVRLPATPSEV